MVSITLLLGVSAAAVCASTVAADWAREPENGHEKAAFLSGPIKREQCYYDLGWDHPGADLSNKPASSFRDCSDPCFADDKCVTWSWSDYNGGTCWFKSSNGGLVQKPGVISLTCSLEKLNVPPTNNNSTSSTCTTLYKDIDFVGNDIANQRGQSGDCCGICEKTKGCSAYAWNNDNGGTCYLKSSVGHVLYKQGVTSGSTKTLYGPVCPFEYDTDFSGNDIGNKPAGDAGVCCSQCKENKACKAYSWSNYNGGTCWMKSGKGKTSKVAGVISAALFP